MKKTQRLCIFCRGTGMSKQHIVPDWLKNVLPRQSEDQHTQHITSVLSMPNSAPHVDVTPIVRNGHQWSRKARNVCDSCNSGWMSQIETNAKDILTNLMLGKRITLTSEDQESLINWITLTTIMAEYTDLKHQAITTIERELFYDTKKSLSNWRIWIGRYKGTEWIQRYRHQGIAAYSSDNIPSTPIPNTQSSTFVFGELFIHVVSTTVNDMNLRLILPKDLKNKMIQLWPIQRQQLRWPPIEVFTPTFTDIQVDTISWEIADILPFYNSDPSF